MRAAVAPTASAACVSAMVSRVQFVPVAATIGTRRDAVSTAISIRRRSSYEDRVGASPVTPQTTRPSLPCAICQATRSANDFSAMSSFSKGVGNAVNEPGNICVLLEEDTSFMSTGDQGEPLAAERDDQSDRGHDGAIDGGVCNELPPKPQWFIRTPHGVRPLP